MRLLAIFGIVGMLGLGVGWYTHVVHMADKAAVLERELKTQQKGIEDLQAENRQLQAHHETREEQLSLNLSKIKGDDDCAHHVLDWGNED